MKTHKNSIAYGAALLMAASMGSVYAADADMTRTQDRVRDPLQLHDPASDQAQDRVRDQLQLRDPASEQAQDRLREHRMEQNADQMKNQIRNEYRYKQNTQTRPTPMNRSTRGAR